MIWSAQAQGQVQFSRLSSMLALLTRTPILCVGVWEERTLGIGIKAQDLVLARPFIRSLDKLLSFSSLRFFFYNRCMRSLPQRITVKTKRDNGGERHINCTHCVKLGPIPVCGDPGFRSSTCLRVSYNGVTLATHWQWFGSVVGYGKAVVYKEEAGGSMVRSMMNKGKGIL